MPLFLIVSAEIYGRKVSKCWKIRNYFELFGPPCRIALADLDGSIYTRMCTGLCPTYWTTFGSAVKNRSGSCPLDKWDQPPFFEFLTPPPPAPGADGPQRGKGHISNIVPTHIKFGRPIPTFSPINVKFGTGERRSAMPNFTFIRATCRPCEKPIFGPLSKNNTGMAALRAGLPVKRSNCYLWRSVIINVL